MFTKYTLFSYEIKVIEMDGNDDWTIVNRKNKKNKPNKNIENKPNKFTKIIKREPTKRDILLTENEKKLLDQEISQNKLDIFCNCCCTHIISDIICRTIVPCGRCYCCAGDDPSFDDDEWVENNVRRICIFGEYNKQYNYKKDEEFFNNFNMY